MADQDIIPTKSVAMPQALISIKFSTMTWLIILGALRGLQAKEVNARLRDWAANEIIRELLIENGYAEDDRETP